MRRPALAAVLSAAVFLCAGPASAQLAPPSTGGAVAAEHARRMLGHNKRVLVIGAHPDDEDTELITLLVRGEGAEAAYLSLNRGEGGQNLIGPELGEALGVLRTEELLSARSLDGGQQYFTRAYDFGYSKSLEDTWAHWPRDSVLKDVVRIIRTFQPQIIVSIFSGTPSDGHGQHQAAGWVAREAFTAAANPARYPELQRDEGLAPWQATKLYRAARFTPAPVMDTLQTGVLDPAVGKSYHQIAMEGRSRHRSQDMGALQTTGPASTRVSPVEIRAGSGGSLWAGIDTTGPCGAPASTPEAILALCQPAKSTRSPDPGGAGPEVETQLRNASAALANAQGLVLDAVSSAADVVPGQALEVTTTLWNAGSEPAHGRIRLTGLAGLPAAREVAVVPGQLLTVVDTVRIPADATTEPYYLRLPRDGAMYRWGNSPDAGQAASPPLLTAEARLDGGVVMTHEVAYRWRDQAVGEQRERLLVVPRVAVRLDRAMIVWPAGDRAPRVVTVILTHGATEATAGEVRLEVPNGWSAPVPQAFRLTRRGEEASFTFRLPPPPRASPGTYELRAIAVDGSGARYTESLQVIDYPHIARRGVVHPATGALRVMDIAVPALRAVGYVRGPADGVPEALAGLGVPVVELTPDSLARGDLSRFDAVIVGSRAYETVPALVEFNARLLAYVRAGGLLLVQYQQYDFFREGFAPYPLEVRGAPLSALVARTATVPPGSPNRPDSHDRVADEAAPVRIINPSSPAVRTPNVIGAADWEGWLQERGLYFARAWAPEYRPVLEMHDPGEPPQEGGLLVATVGHGTYVYTGLSFHRQLPAGVPGALRLFMNLLALQPAAAQP